MGRAPRRDRGAVLMEAAFVIPILFMLVIGMVSYGLALGQQNSLDNAVREASRYGATHPSSNITAWLDTVSDAVVSASTGDLDADTADRYICVSLVGSENPGRKVIQGSGAGTYSSGDCPGLSGCPAASACVQVVVSRSAVLDAGLFRRTVTLDSTGVSSYERE